MDGGGAARLAATPVVVFPTPSYVLIDGRGGGRKLAIAPAASCPGTALLVDETEPGTLIGKIFRNIAMFPIFHHLAKTEKKY